MLYAVLLTAYRVVGPKLCSLWKGLFVLRAWHTFPVLLELYFVRPIAEACQLSEVRCVLRPNCASHKSFVRAIDTL